jgi:DNA-binding transcriptional LysR family regulator
MAFTLRQISVFIQAAADENFRKTADRLGISQPAISRHIRLLEEHAGGKLFVRSRGSAARLSSLGQEMLVEAHALLRSARKVGGQPVDEGAREITVRIAAGNYLLDRFIRPHVRSFVREGEHINLEFVPAARHEDLLQMVREGVVDCAFYTGGIMPVTGLEFVMLKATSIGLYAVPELVAKANRIPQDLADLPFCLSSKGTQAEVWQLDILESVGIVPARVAIRSQFIEVVIASIVEGKALGIMFDSDVKHAFNEGRIVRLPVNLPSGARIMARRSDAPLDRCKGRVIDAICKVMQRD